MKTKNYYLKSWLLMMLMLIGAGGNVWAAETGTITFGSDNVKINAASVTCNDSQGSTWTITTVGTTSFTPQPTYSQVGSSSKPATSITFTTTLASEVKITSMSAKFGGFSGTAGTVTLKVGETAIGTGSLNGTNDVIVKSSSTATGSVLTVTLTGISKGVKCYNISYTYATQSDGPVDPDVSFETNSLSLEVGETATNEISKPSDLNVTYASGNQSVASVDANGVVTGVAEGETTITASWNVVEGKYNAGSKSYAVNVTPATPSTTYVKVTNLNKLVAGNEYVVVSQTSEKSYVMGAPSSDGKYREPIEIDVENNSVAIKNETAVVLTLGGTSGEWTFLASDNNSYLAYPDNSNNQLTSEPNVSDKSRWIIGNDLRLQNKANKSYYIEYSASASRFSCYKGTSNKAYLYVKEGSAINDKETATVSIDVTELTVGGETAQITAVPEDLVMTCESSASAIASVTADGTVTGLAHGSASISVSWDEQTIEGLTYAAGNIAFDITVTDPNRPGTANKPYTVAQARAAIDAGTDVTGVFATGIVSEIVTPYNSQYGNISYNISADGTTTADQLQAYRGKSFNGDKFTSENDIQVGDVVVIYGDLIKFGDSTYEFAADNRLISQQHPKHTVTWMVNGEEKGTSEIEAGSDLTYDTPEDILGKTFVGWVTETIDGETDEAPTFITTMPNEDVTLYAVFANKTEGSVTEVTDELTREFTDVSGTSYSSWTGKTATSNAVYAGQSAGGNESIQLRSTNPSGIISTTSGGKVTNVTVIWNENTTSGRTLDVYGLNTAYESPADLYSSDTQGTKLGSIVMGTNTELDITDDYQYIGLRSNSGAMYLSKISITWEGGTPATYSGYCTTVIKPVAKIGNKGFETLQAAVDAAEAGQTIDIVDDFTLTTVTTSPSDKYNVNVNKSVTINGNGHVITSAEGKRAIVLEGEGLDVTIKDLTIKNNKAEACLWIASNLTCTLDNTVLDGTNGKTYNQPLTIGGIDTDGRVTLNVTNGSVIKTNDEGTAHYSIIAWHPADITVTESKLIGWATVYLKPDAAGSTVMIDGSEMKSQGLSGDSNNFAVIVTESGNNTIEVKDTKITASAVEGTYQSLVYLNGENNVVKLLGETTYETNDLTYGAITFNWGSLKNNKLYLDDATKAAFAEFLDGSHNETIEPADETGLYPVSFEPEVLYYWAVEGGYQGGYYSFAEPFEEGWLDNGEFIALQKDIVLEKDITCQLTEGTSFNFLLGEFTADKNGHSVSLATGVTVLTDKQTDIFSAAEEGYAIIETKTDEGYSYTAEKVEVVAPIVFHDSGIYEETLTVPMYAQEGAIIKYTVNGGEEQTYTGPVAISETTTLKAWAELLGAKSGEVEKTFTITPYEYTGDTFDGYYEIKNSKTGQYVNVAGRKTVTFVDAEAAKSAPGTIIKLETGVNDKNGKAGMVKVLRSQGIDLPAYAEKAMNYVPQIVQMAVDKLGAEGSGALLGENGLKALMDKFDESFDYHLYLEKPKNEGEYYRIYGKTPSMTPVVDFYAENKDNVDEKLTMLEQFINETIQRVLEKTQQHGAGVLVPFSLDSIWVRMGKTLTEPVDEVSTKKFYEEVLTSETNVWNFAYHTAMFYWGRLKSSETFQNNLDQLGDYAKYIDKVENIQPNFKYYIVQQNGPMDIISEGNDAILNSDVDASADFTTWTLEERTDFQVTFSEDNKLKDKYYTTLYTDFAYTLPEGVKAYKVTDIEESGCFGYAVTEEIEAEAIAEQTPVLLVAESAGDLEFDLSESGTTIDGNTNKLKGPDYLINTYEIKTAQVESLFDMAKALLGQEAYNTYLSEYEHLMLRTAGTVNNKYFFGLSKDDCKNLDENVCMLGNSEDMGTVFANNWQAMNANQAFLPSDIYTEIRLTKVGDVNSDGQISIADVTALVNIILGKDNEKPYKYDHSAADVNCDESISIADVTALVNIILGKTN